MSKKRLSDLLREEISPDSGKSAESPSLSETIAPGTPSSSPQDISKSVTNKTPAADVPKVATKSRSQPDQTAAAELAGVKAALQAEKNQVVQLTTQLAEQKQAVITHSKTLETANQQIKNLEKRLKKEQSAVKRLTEQLTNLTTVQEALTAEKQLVSKLYAQIQHLEAESKKRRPPVSSSIAPAPKPASLTPLPRPLTARYVAPVQPSSSLTDDDIGWFD